MTARIAYRIPAAASDQDALQGPATARIRRGLPVRAAEPSDCLMSQAHHQGGRLLLWPRCDGSSVPAEMLGAPRKTPEGWEYYPSREPFDIITLIRPEIERPKDGQWITTSKGHDLWIAIAVLSQRDLILRADGSLESGGYSTEFGILGHELYDQYFSREGISDHVKMVRMVQLCLQQSYYLTEEMIEDISPSWFTPRDLGLIVHALMGLDPKEYAAALARSASSTKGADSPISRSRPRKRRPFTSGQRKPAKHRT